jgi:hypothetical protein
MRLLTNSLLAFNVNRTTNVSSRSGVGHCARGTVARLFQQEIFVLFRWAFFQDNTTLQMQISELKCKHMHGIW